MIFHSDQGLPGWIQPVSQRPLEPSQYTSGQYARAADEVGVRLSVGRKGQCWEITSALSKGALRTTSPRAHDQERYTRLGRECLDNPGSSVEPTIFGTWPLT